jgi:hypothetical protein
MFGAAAWTRSRWFATRGRPRAPTHGSPAPAPHAGHATARTSDRLGVLAAAAVLVFDLLIGAPFS